MIPIIYLICPVTRCSAYLIMALESKIKHRQSNVLCKPRCHFFRRVYSNCSSRILPSFPLCNHYIRRVQLYTFWRNIVHFSAKFCTLYFTTYNRSFFSYPVVLFCVSAEQRICSNQMTADATHLDIAARLLCA